MKIQVIFFKTKSFICSNITKTFLISVYIGNKFNELITNYFKEVMRLYIIVYVIKDNLELKSTKTILNPIKL